MFRRYPYFILSIFILFSTSGCKLLESLTSDVGGWDVSACVDGFGTCWELFWDNSDKFEDGFVDALGGL